MTDRLVTLLEDAASAASFPETPPLAERVRARIESGPLPVAEIRLPRTRPSLARPAAAFAVVALALGLTLSLSVTARRAVADLLGVVGIEITFDDEPGVTPLPPEEIDLGDRVSQQAASRRAGFEVRTLTGVEADPAFYFDRTVGRHGMVSIVYPAEATSLADADLLVSEFRAGLREELVKKLGTMGSEIRYLRVRGSEAYWIGGEPHFFFYLQRDGAVRQETVRLAGNVLLWAEDGVTYRIEGADSLAEARRLATSLR